MFKNPLKYASGGDMLSSEQQAENDFISVIAEGLGAQPEQVKARLEQIKSNPTESQQLQEALQLMQQDKNKGFQAVLSLFAGKPQSAKRGGKIQDFICKHAKGGIAGCGCVKKAQDGTNVPQYQVMRDTTYMNPVNQRIMEQVIVGPDGQAYRRTTVNGTNPIAVGGYWNENQFYPEGDSSIPNNRFDSLFRRAIPKVQKTQSNQNVVKNQNPAGPMPEPDSSYFGTISQGKPRSKFTKAIDDNSKARNFINGTKQFVNSPMVRLPLAGAAAYGGWQLAGTPIIQATGELASKIAPYLFPFLSQLRPKFVADTINPTKTTEKSWHNTFWAIPSNEDGGKVQKVQDGTRSLYQQITADGPETYVDGYGTVREMSESPIITGLRKAYHWINMDRTLSDNAYSQKHGYSKPLTGMPPAVYVSPIAQEINLAKYIGFRTPTQASLNQRGAATIKAEADRLKRIEAATKEGKIYIEPKPSDLDIDKLPTFIDRSKDYIITLKGIKFTK